MKTESCATTGKPERRAKHLPLICWRNVHLYSSESQDSLLSAVLPDTDVGALTGVGCHIGSQTVGRPPFWLSHDRVGVQRYY